MAILVTGGAGYIGGHVVRELREAGEAVVVIDDLSAGSRSVVPPEVPLIAGDCGDQELVAAALDGHRISTVIDLAGAPSSPDARAIITRWACSGGASPIVTRTAARKFESAAPERRESTRRPVAQHRARGYANHRHRQYGPRLRPASPIRSGVMHARQRFQSRFEQV